MKWRGPQLNNPLEENVCGGKIKITTIEIWEASHLEERVMPFLNGKVLKFSPPPDLIVGSFFRLVVSSCQHGASFCEEVVSIYQDPRAYTH